MDKLPKGVKQLVYRYEFEDSSSLVRIELNLETWHIKTELDMGMTDVRDAQKIMRCLNCSIGWVISTNYDSRCCLSCIKDLLNSNPFHPPLRYKA